VTSKSVSVISVDAATLELASSALALSSDDEPPEQAEMSILLQMQILSSNGFIGDFLFAYTNNRVLKSLLLGVLFQEVSSNIQKKCERNMKKMCN
jgi:hypothetical protein